jgi:hypothetical protein
MKKLLLAVSVLLTSCTYNVSMAHTEGTASDVIDDNQSNEPNVSPSVTIPVKPM